MMVQLLSQPRTSMLKQLHTQKARGGRGPRGPAARCSTCVTLPSPRAATSVANMMGCVPFLNSCSTQSRSCWLLSPCSPSAG